LDFKEDKERQLVPVKIWGLILDPHTSQVVVLLLDPEGERLLPIWIGMMEGNAIARALEKVKTPRPLTHDLLYDILTTLQVQLTKVIVTELREQVFYASLYLKVDEEEIVIDARPSDAIALAVRAQAPIYCTEEVLKAGEDLNALKEKLKRTSQDPLAQWLTGLHEEDFGKYKM